MGKGRDKRKKREAPSKAALRAEKQTKKLLKHEQKADAAGDDDAPQGFNNEEAIETTLKRILKSQRHVKTVEELSNVDPPTPRVNALLLPHPERDQELILFGGEFWNGAVTQAYNDTYFYNTKRNTWGRLSCAVNPAPRSSSQGVVYKQYVVLFGGEFVSQSQSQYLHFRDVWRYDARRSEWEEVKTPKGGPSSRSGHRMVLWKRQAVVFGGFYDNAMECHYYNDLWLLSGLDGAARWTAVQPTATAELPQPRSGHNMAVYQDTLFVYGGYSTEKFNRFKKSEATVHHDLWMIHLPREDGAGPVMWQKLRLGGVPPPIRAGVASTFRDRRLYLFGGVVDIESPGGAMVSTFHNDLFVFHMDTRRFYPVVLRPGGRRRGAEAARAAAGAAKATTADRARGNDLAAELQALQLQGGDDRKAPSRPERGTSSASFSSSSSSSSSASSEAGDTAAETHGAAEPSTAMRESFERGRDGQIYPHRRMDAAMTIVGSVLYIYGGQFETGEKEITMSDLFALNLNRLESYEVLLSQDLSAAVWLGKSAESEAGSWESGSTVVSAVFDLDYDDDDNNDEEGGSSNNNDDDEGAMSGRRAGAAGTTPRHVPAPPPAPLLSEDDADEAPEAIPAVLDTEVTPSVIDVAVDRLVHRRGKKGLQVHKEQLLAQLSVSAAVPTPTPDETLHAFYERTASFWTQAAQDANVGEELLGRRLHKEARAFARRRYDEASALLRQLRLVEERERAEAAFFRERRLEREREWAQQQEAEADEEGEGEDEQSGEVHKGGVAQAS